MSVLTTASLGSVSHHDVVSETVPGIEEENPLAPTPTTTTCSFVKVEIPQPPVVLAPAFKFTETVPYFSNTHVEEELNHPMHTRTGTGFTANYIFKKANPDMHQYVDVWDVEMEPVVVLPEPLIVFEALCVEVPLWEDILPPETINVAALNSAVNKETSSSFGGCGEASMGNAKQDLLNFQVSQSHLVSLVFLLFCIALSFLARSCIPRIHQAQIERERAEWERQERERLQQEKARLRQIGARVFAQAAAASRARIRAQVSVSQAIIPAVSCAIVQYGNADQMLPMGLATHGVGNDTNGADCKDTDHRANTDADRAGTNGAGTNGADTDGSNINGAWVNEINFVGILNNNGDPLSSSEIVQGFLDDCWLVENLYLPCAKLVMQCDKDLTLNSPDMRGVDFVNLHAPCILKMFHEATKHFDFKDEPYAHAALRFHALCQCTKADAEQGNDAASIKYGFVGGRFILGNGCWAWSGLHHWQDVHGRGKDIYRNLKFLLQLFNSLDKDDVNTKKLSALVQKNCKLYTGTVLSIDEYIQ